MKLYIDRITERLGFYPAVNYIEIENDSKSLDFVHIVKYSVNKKTGKKIIFQNSRVRATMKAYILQGYTLAR